MSSTIVVWSSFAFGLVAMVVSLVSAWQTGRVTTRDSFHIAHAMFIDLTTGDVERGRNTIGILRYGTSDWQKDVTYTEILESYYVVAWAFERTGYGLLGLKPAGRQVTESLQAAVTWHLEELRDALVLLHRALDDTLKDEKSWQRICEVAGRLGMQASEPHEDELDKCKNRLAMLRSAA